MPRRDPVEQLRTLNELLARTAASDPERAEHARRALDFFSEEQARMTEGTMTPSVEGCARACTPSPGRPSGRPDCIQSLAYPGRAGL